MEVFTIQVLSNLVFIFSLNWERKMVDFILEMPNIIK